MTLQVCTYNKDMSKYTNHPTHILTSLATYVHSEAQSVSLSQTSIIRVLERFLFTFAAKFKPFQR